MKRIPLLKVLLYLCYELIAPTSVLDQLLKPVTDSFTPEVARRRINLRADDVTQARIDELADKCTEGELTAEERAEYESYVHAIEVISLLQAKARERLSSRGIMSLRSEM